MTYLVCEIAQCVVMTLNPGGMGIINKLYYIISLFQLVYLQFLLHQ